MKPGHTGRSELRLLRDGDMGFAVRMGFAIRFAISVRFDFRDDPALEEICLHDSHLLTPRCGAAIESLSV
ncbi:hypothetical protein DYH09_28470 [bacterium CPR1]|nr:hypothetical protein [bacterium CPR1]